MVTTNHTPPPPDATDTPHLGPAEPAMPDLLCWIYAAVPLNPRTGRPDVHRVAKILNVTPATVYRWIRNADDREFGPQAITTLRNRAQLRGHGEILWPAIDPTTASRHTNNLTTALAFRDDMRRNPTTPAALKAHRPTQVITYYNDTARVFGIITASTATNRNRALAPRTGNTLVDQMTVDDSHTATAIKYTALQLIGDDRCIAPDTLFKKGRTEVWRRLHHDRSTRTRYTTDIDLHQIATPILNT